jgi:hypothetical protein
MEIAEYIYTILKSQKTIMWSWGFNTPAALADNKGLAFKVNGFIHKGWVKVIYNEGNDLFNIVLINRKRTVVREIEGIYFDQLVEVIDNAIEKTNDYKQKVETEYQTIKL